KSDRFTDPGFEGKIDLRKISAAWADGDPTLLADMAFRMAEEERILQRPHKFVPAKTLFQATLALAVAGNDEATLARLEKGLKDKPEQKEVYAKLQASKQLALASRTTTPALLVSIDQIPTPSFIVYRVVLEKVKAAKRTQDRGTLDGLAA